MLNKNLNLFYLSIYQYIGEDVIYRNIMSFCQPIYLHIDYLFIYIIYKYEYILFKIGTMVS